MLDNLEVFGTMGCYSPIYQANIHAKPCRDMGPAAEYSRDELQYFRADFRGKRQVDEALARLGDISLQAKVRRYRASMEVVAELKADIKKLEDDIYVHVDQARHSATRLGRAHALRRTNSLRKDLRKAKEKLQTKPGFLHRELNITWSRLMDTQQELEEAWRDLENAHQELKNSQQVLRNAQWALKFTQQQVRTPPPHPIEGTTTSSTGPEWIILSP
ncbi:hypothetical protein EI94DRAFT_1812016 [Lactarius quietus]|nr:hypothetical protein EI94DRAFT_1812016 [Lactarius quietus]